MGGYQGTGRAVSIVLLKVVSKMYPLTCLRLLETHTGHKNYPSIKSLPPFMMGIECVALPPQNAKQDGILTRIISMPEKGITELKALNGVKVEIQGDE